MPTTDVRTPLAPNEVATSPSIVSSSSRVIKSLDGVRGFAILSVVLGHYSSFTKGVSWINGSAIGVIRYFLYQAATITGVYLFFVLSGFLLFLPYARALLTPGSTWPRARVFYGRRIRRILPAYSLIFLTVMGCVLFESARHHTQIPWGQLALAIMPFYNLNSSAYELMAGNTPLIGSFDYPLWSLAVEWQFYLILPLIAWGLSRLGSMRRIVLALLCIIGFGVLVRAGILWLIHANGTLTPTDTPGPLGIASALVFGLDGKALEVFAIGMLASLFYVWAIEQKRWTSQQLRRLAHILLPLWVTSFLFSSLWWAMAQGDPHIQHTTDTMSLLWFVFYTTVNGICGVSLMVSVLCLPHSLGRLFSLRPLTFTGLISYSLYLWHWPIAQLAMRIGIVSPALLIIALGPVFAWSAALYYLIERPFLRYRR